jgi:ribonucleotide reductase beta subunit family protein with ferritin-like domain
MTEKKFELLTADTNDRYCLFPIKYHDMWEMYKKHEAAMWTAEEIDMSIDKKEWKTLSDPEKHFITNILAFFANSDSIVLENLITNFSKEITIPEARCFYGFQGMIENIHSEVYNLMIDTFVDDETYKQKLFRGMETIPCVQKKAEWALHWITDGSSLAKRLFAFGIVEGLFFSGSFCAIFWLKEKGKLVNSLGKSNEWISRDEGLHTDFAILLYKYISNRIPKSEAEQIMREAVNIEEEFICNSISVDMIGMNCTLMKQYIRYVADRLLVQFGYEKIYHDNCPFAFMQKISLDGKTNFFEQRVSEYNLAQGCTNNETLFALDNLDTIIF